MDKNLSNLLQWSIENTVPNDSPQANPRTLDPELLASLMGGPSDADLMKSSMATIQSPDTPHEEKLVAFDNFEQLIEQIDNANNLEALGLWTPLVELLGTEAASDDETKTSESADLRRMAAWCVGTAVQNNPKSQERALLVGVIPHLVRLATEDANSNVRRKAVYGLSSEVRNYQPGLDEVLKYLPDSLEGGGKIDAADMNAVDGLMDKLRSLTVG